MRELEGAMVAVVGGGSGIGRAVAQAAVAEGASVVLIGRTAARLQAAAKELGPAASCIVADARDPTSLRCGLGGVTHLDHLVLTISVSATSLGVNSRLDAMPAEGSMAYLEGKFWAQYRFVQAALPLLSTAGSINFTSGVASRKSLPGHTVIAATNGAIEAMARQLAREIAPRRVNVIAPGLTDTRAYDHLSPQERQAFFDHVSRQLPLARVAQPCEIARAYLFAMTATYLTGSVIDIDGGLLAN